MLFVFRRQHRVRDTRQSHHQTWTIEARLGRSFAMYRCWDPLPPLDTTTTTTTPPHLSHATPLGPSISDHPSTRVYNESSSAFGAWHHLVQFALRPSRLSPLNSQARGHACGSQRARRPPPRRRQPWRCACARLPSRAPPTSAARTGAPSPSTATWAAGAFARRRSLIQSTESRTCTPGSLQLPPVPR